MKRRFKIGDLAKLVVCKGVVPRGSIVEVAVVRPEFGKIYGIGDRLHKIHKPNMDYAVLYGADGNLYVVYDWQLAPLDPPAEPASLTRREELEENV